MAKSNGKWGQVDTETLERRRYHHDLRSGTRAFFGVVVGYLWPLCTALIALWLAWRVGFLPPLLGFGLALAAVGIALFSGFAAIKAAFSGVSIDFADDDPTLLGRLLHRLWFVLFGLCLYGTTTTCTSACGLAVWNWGRNFFR